MRFIKRKGLIVNLGYVILFTFILLNVLTVQTLADIIPSERRVTWHGNVGVKDGIPTNYTKYGSTIETADQGDDRTAIQNALNAASPGQYILLGSGIFTVSGTITIPDNVILRGQGIDSTVIQQTSSSSGATIVFSTASFSKTDYNLASGYTKGSTTITTSSSHSWTAGDLIIIDENAPGTSYDPPVTNVGAEGTCSWCGRDGGSRCLGQMAYIVSGSGTSATLEIPLYWDYESSFTPQGCEVVNPRKWAGLEELTIDNSSTMNNNQEETGTINMSGCLNCWILNVEVYGAKRMGIVLARSYRCTIRGVEIHKTLHYTSNNGYSIWCRFGISACLIENCIIYDMASSIILNGPCSGNVFGYNYTTNLQSTDYPTAVRSCWTTHGGHSMMNLVEGNYSDGQHITCDFTWGSGSNETFFRNRILTDPEKSAQRTCISFSTRNYYANFVGNVLGTDGRETVYISTSMPFGGDPACIYVFRSGDGTQATAILHGNWDYFHDSVVWDAGIDDHTLPNSYYLTDRPSWWGDLPWPIIGPDLSPMDGDIPAKLRYEGVYIPPSRLPKQPIVKEIITFDLQEIY